MNNVPGEENCADLLTKHLGFKRIDRNIDRLRMSFETGRAAKVAALHAVYVARDEHNNDNDGDDNGYDIGGFADWQSLCRAANDQRGGDRWESRGVGGIWHRGHTSPRLSALQGGEGSG